MKKGREKRKAINRKKKKKELVKDFIYNGYKFSELKEKIIEVKFERELYIGYVDNFTVSMWMPNVLYARLDLITPNEMVNFYFTYSKKIGFDAMKGRVNHYNSSGLYNCQKRAKIVRILPEVDALMFKIEHDL